MYAHWKEGVMTAIALMLSALFLVSIPICIISWYAYFDRRNARFMRQYATDVYAEQKIQLLIWRRLFELSLMRYFAILRREEDLFRLAACSQQAMQAFSVWQQEVHALTTEDTWAISSESQTAKRNQLFELEQACHLPMSTLQQLCEKRLEERALGEWCVHDSAKYLETLHSAIVDANARLAEMQHTYLHHSEYQTLFDHICDCMGDEALCAYWVESAHGEYALNGAHTEHMAIIAQHLREVATRIEKNVTDITQRLQYFTEQAESIQSRVAQVRQRLQAQLQRLHGDSEQTFLQHNLFLLSAWVDKAEKICKFGLPLHARYARVYIDHAEYLLTVVETR